MSLTHAEPVLAQPVPHRPRMLVAVDGGPASRAALRWTADRAGFEGADIRLATVIANDASEESEEAEARMLFGSRVVLDTISENSSVDTRLRRGDPATQIIAAAEDFGADLIVIGTHATAKDDRSVLRSVPGRVASGADAPVAVIPVGWMPKAGAAVAGWSSDSAAAAAAEYAAADARRSGSALVLVHVWDLPTDGEIPVTPGGTESIPERQAAYLDGVASQFRDSSEDAMVRTEVRHGRPVAELLAAAARARVLVVGRRARNAISRLLLGSVSRAVLGAPPCPVIVVPAPSAGLRVTPDFPKEDL